MRAQEFLSEDKTVTINIPINITIPSGSGDPIVSANEPVDQEDLPEDPVFVSPLQQSLELEKHKSGKRSAVINQILDDNGAYGTANEQIEFDIRTDFNKLAAVYDSLAESKKSQ